MSLALVLQAAANATRTIANPANLASQSPALANSTSLQGIVPAIQNFATNFAANVTAVTVTMDNAAIDIAKVAVVFLVIAGVLLWFTHLNKHLGKELVSGGIIIGLFVEFVVPFLLSIRF